MLACLLAAAGTRPTHAIDVSEHSQIASTSLDTVMTACGFMTPRGYRFMLDDDRFVELERELADSSTIGDLCAIYAKDDRALSRYHIKGWTVYNQLRLLSAVEIGSAWELHQSGVASSAELSDHNVVANYLLHHYIALRLAQRAGEAVSEADLRRALVYEAMALGFLHDAFSSGHMMVPLTDRFQFFHPTNSRKTHDAFSNDGIYVMNSKGDAWLTFGDKLAGWYAATAHAVENATRTSILELVLVFLAAGDGDLPDGVSDWVYENIGFDWQDVVVGWPALLDGVEYYDELHLPTLMQIPMPISATWSVDTGISGSLSAERFHYPQLADSGYHDTTLDDSERRALYRRADMPRWLVYSKLRQRSPEDLIREDATVASVRYMQKRDYDPAMAGIIISGSFGWATYQKADGAIYGAGIGYGVFDDLTILNKLSVILNVYPGYDESDRILLSPALQFGIVLPGEPLGLFARNHIEMGWAWGVSEDPLDSNGFRFGLGLDPWTIPFGFTNAGVTIRLKYQWMFLESVKDGPQVEFILH